VQDGQLLAAIAEERLTRLKADMGYPERSIDRILKTTGISSQDIDIVAVHGVSDDPFQRLYKSNAIFSTRDWINQCEEYWKPVLIDKRPLTPLDDFNMFKHLRGEELEEDPYYPFIERINGKNQKEYSVIFNNLRKEVIKRHLGISPEKIHFYRHEDCHKAYGYYSSPFNSEKTLVFIVEGRGDDSSASVSIIENNNITEHWRSNSVHLGRLYRYVTLILGMLPLQHEYKVMGLAPYGTEYHGKRSLAVFRKINKVVGNEIHDNNAFPDLYYSINDALEGERFDGIAWGLQTYIEEMLTDWIANNCKSHGINNVVISGGVAQNIKSCKKIMELPEVDRFWCGPISGDGSLAIGAAWLASTKFAPERDIKGLQNVYLGTTYDEKGVNEAVNKYSLRSKYHCIENPDNDLIAKWICQGHVIARFSGAMEFGQRALGNRSIMADPRIYKSVEHINNKIKYRDFWMPFTPSMHYEEVERLIINPKGIHSPFMTMAFDLKPEYVDIIPAVIHPADKTIRPQMLKREENPDFYDLISAFKKRSGFGVLLNTSFNLHGEPIVESPEDAVSTFVRPDLDVLLFDNIAILRVKP
jgi:carbamoyltransferase